MTIITDDRPDTAEDTRLVDAAALVRIATGGASVQWTCAGVGVQPTPLCNYVAIIYRPGLVSLRRVNADGIAVYHLGDITARTTARDAWLMRQRYAQRRAAEIGLVAR